MYKLYRKIKTTIFSGSEVVLLVDCILLAEYLKLYHVGKERAIKAKYLRNFGSDRNIRKAVNQARKEGYMICSGDVGYYYAAGIEELNETIHRLEAYVNETQQIVQALHTSKNVYHV